MSVAETSIESYKNLISEWNQKTETEKRELVRKLINRNPGEYYSDFGSYVQRQEFIALLDSFIAIVVQYKKTHDHFGAKAIWEILRWEYFSKDGGSEFKLNNNYASSVSRLAKQLFPEQLETFFETRRAA